MDPFLAALCPAPPQVLGQEPQRRVPGPLPPAGPPLRSKGGRPASEMPKMDFLLVSQLPYLRTFQNGKLRIQESAREVASSGQPSPSQHLHWHQNRHRQNPGRAQPGRPSPHQLHSYSPAAPTRHRCAARPPLCVCSPLGPQHCGSRRPPSTRAHPLRRGRWANSLPHLRSTSVAPGALGPSPHQPSVFGGGGALSQGPPLAPPVCHLSEKGLQASVDPAKLPLLTGPPLAA